MNRVFCCQCFAVGVECKIVNAHAKAKAVQQRNTIPPLASDLHKAN